MINLRTVQSILSALALTSCLTSNLAEEVAIPDPGLNAANREALGKPISPLTVTDMLSLTNLNARNRNVSSLVGLEAARNLASLDLEINQLSDVSLLSALTNLSELDLSDNPLTNSLLPGTSSASAWCSSRNRNKPHAVRTTLTQVLLSSEEQSGAV